MSFVLLIPTQLQIVLKSNMDVYDFSLSRALYGAANTICFMTFFVVLLAVHTYMKWRKEKSLNLPSGPFSYPCFGYYPHMRTDYYIQFTQFNQKYGPVFQIFMGSNRLVVVSDPVLVREAFKQPVFSGRPDTELTKILQGYGKSE